MLKFIVWQGNVSLRFELWSIVQGSLVFLPFVIVVMKTIGVEI